MQYASRLVHIVALSALVLVNVAWGQQQSGQGTQRTPTYPYGCVEDEPEDVYTTLRCSGAEFSKATFDRLSNFRRATFDSKAVFSYATFDRRANFRSATFDSLANFRSATFDSNADFNGATFDSDADFSHATFDNEAYFRRAMFDSKADFSFAKFESRADFFHTTFDSRADFFHTTFDSLANFRSATFDSKAVFSYATFDSRAEFKGSRFNSRADFGSVTFDSLASFNSASFWEAANFHEAEFNKTAVADFTRASVRDTVRIGNWDGAQRFNFRRANLLPGGRDVRPSDSVEVTFPGAAVVLHAPADIQLQVKKFDFLHLEDTLSYFDKKNIVTYLKDNGFNEDDQKTARFELDYLLARSTMDQRPRGTYREYPLYHYRLWWNHVYYYLMGFGYRPFWIFGWAGGLVLLFGTYYLWKMPHQTYAYVQGNPPGKSENPDNSGQPHPLSLLIHCFYFSTMLVFTFRLKRRLLTFFDAREQGIVTAQWGMGFLIYIAFLTLAKSGSILQQLKVLFVG